jgi:glycosyltransferase involved in cell wall biosynthesis
MKKGISVLICTHNGSEKIKKTLDHLSKQKVDPSIQWEIVLVDNASTDATAEVAQSAWTSKIPLRIIYEAQLGVAYARISGMNACHFSYIGIVDDDNWVVENWVETAYNAMESHPDAGAIGGPSEPVFESHAPEWFLRYSKNYAVGEQYKEPGKIAKETGLLWGAGLIIRKEAWDILYRHGFTPLLISRKGKSLLSGEESEMLLLFKLMGLFLYYSPDLKIRHFMPTGRLNWKYYLRLRKGLGASSVYLERYRSVIDTISQGRSPSPVPWATDLTKSFLSVARDPLALLAGVLNFKQGNFRIAMAYFHWGRLIEKIKLGAKQRNLAITLYNKYAPLKNIWPDRPAISTVAETK